jgi:hypothetical protein
LRLSHTCGFEFIDRFKDTNRPHGQSPLPITLTAAPLRLTPMGDCRIDKRFSAKLRSRVVPDGLVKVARQ